MVEKDYSFIGKWGIFLTTGLTWLVTAVFAFVRYKGGAWEKKSLVSFDDNKQNHIYLKN